MWWFEGERIGVVCRQQHWCRSGDGVGTGVAVGIEVGVWVHEWGIMVGHVEGHGVRITMGPR